MLPKFGDDLKNDFSKYERPSRTYKLNERNYSIRGETDGIDAMKQAIVLVLNTERYEHEIYSWNYGVELSNLIGKPAPLVYSLIKERICDALICDDRILSVDSFEFQREGSKVTVQFKVGTIFGDIQVGKEVAV